MATLAEVSDFLDRNTAVYDSWREAKAAADAAMPRRKHNRPYPQSSGYWWAQRGHVDSWIVCANSNLILLRNGDMFDHARQRVIGR
jgi:hypothetical protein